MKMTVKRKITADQLKLFTMIAPVFFVQEILVPSQSIIYTKVGPVNFIKAYGPCTTTFYTFKHEKQNNNNNVL